MVRSPRPPRKPAPTPWARFLVEQRLARGWSQKKAFETFREPRGWKEDSRASYGALERGQREPDADEQRYFLTFYGVGALPAEVTADPEPTLASALSDLAKELREARQARDDFEARLVAVEAELALRAQRASAEQPGQSARTGTAG